jgi:hypothetical protein
VCPPRVTTFTLFLMVLLPEGQHLYAYKNVDIWIEQFLFSSQVRSICSTTNMDHHKTVVIGLTDQCSIPPTTCFDMDSSYNEQRIYVAGLAEDTVCIQYSSIHHFGGCKDHDRCNHPGQHDYFSPTSARSFLCVPGTAMVFSAPS